MKVVELRNYLLKPGTRDRFIQYFKDHFLESQNILGAYTPGLFRIKGEDDRFFWIRGFDTMQKRSQFLPTFYGGEVWKKFGPAANDMMLEWHNVHLVKPLANSSNPFSEGKKVFVIDYYQAKEKKLNELIDLFSKEYILFFKKWNITTMLLLSEMQENDFPRLAVYQDENLLAVITGYNNEPEYESILNQFRTTHIESASRMKELIQNKTSLILYPA